MIHQQVSLLLNGNGNALSAHLIFSGYWMAVLQWSIPKSRSIIWKMEQLHILPKIVMEKPFINMTSTKQCSMTQPFSRNRNTSTMCFRMWERNIAIICWKNKLTIWATDRSINWNDAKHSFGIPVAHQWKVGNIPIDMELYLLFPKPLPLVISTLLPTNCSDTHSSTSVT